MAAAEGRPCNFSRPRLLSMHELSIALGILDIVQETCGKEGIARVEKVRVKIGRASGIMPDALLFSFECARSGTVADGALLEVEEVPVGGHCEDCNRDFTVEEKYVLACPRCGGASFRVHSGQELEIIDLEGED